jgi:hypothetical protein
MEPLEGVSGGFMYAPDDSPLPFTATPVYNLKPGWRAGHVV